MPEIPAWIHIITRGRAGEIGAHLCMHKMDKGKITRKYGGHHVPSFAFDVNSASTLLQYDRSDTCTLYLGKVQYIS